MKIDIKFLRDLEKKINSPGLQSQLRSLPEKKEVAAIIAQAIGDNFAQQGPGWKPLQAATIRSSVSKKLRKKLSSLSDRQILAHEAKARKKDATEAPHRMILQKTGLLKKSVTTPGATENIKKVEGTNLIWGSQLIYAKTHNEGLAKKNIPKREFLVLRDVWKQRLYVYLAKEITKMVVDSIQGAKA